MSWLWRVLSASLDGVHAPGEIPLGNSSRYALRLRSVCLGYAFEYVLKSLCWLGVSEGEDALGRASEPPRKGIAGHDLRRIFECLKRKDQEAMRRGWRRALSIEDGKEDYSLDWFYDFCCHPQRRYSVGINEGTPEGAAVARLLSRRMFPNDDEDAEAKWDGDPRVWAEQVRAGSDLDQELPAWTGAFEAMWEHARSRYLEAWSRTPDECQSTD